MANQYTTSPTQKSIVRAALVALALIALSGFLNQLSLQATRLVSGAATETLALLPSFVLAGWQALQPHVCDRSGTSLFALQMLVSSWSLLQAMACAA